jgi:surface polysaccharide O-acyltransferase-like enzyme
VVPAALIGPAIAHIRPGTGRTTYVLAAIGGGVLFALVAYGWTDVTPLLVSLPVCALVWEIPAPAGARLLRWSRLTFGVYLVHPLLMHILSRWSAGNPWLEAAMVAVGSFAAIEIIRRTPLARFVGENTAAARSG